MRIKKQSADHGNKYFASGIHQLTYPECGKKYGDQIVQILRQYL
jgi:hypothetical protein